MSWFASLFGLITILTDVQWSVSPGVPDAGIPFTVQLRLEGQGRNAPDIKVAPPEVEGLDILDGPDVRSGSNISIVNGQASAAWTRTLSWTVVAESSGAFRLPKVTAVSSSFEVEVPERLVVVRALKPSEDVFVELRCSNPSPWVEELVDLELTVLFRPFRDEELGTRVSSQDLLTMIDWERSVLGRFSSIINDRDRRGLSQFVRGRGEQEGWDGFRWTVSTRFRTSGTATLDPVRIVGSYPVSLVRTNTVFGTSVRVARRSPVRVDTPPIDIEVRTPPLADRPSDWSGAMGRFGLSASLDRVVLQMGEPVTLTLRIEDLNGSADLARLPDPPVDELLSAAGWEVSPDPAPGKVEGEVRTLRRSIRPMRNAVELPRLRLPSFDPVTNAWTVATSEAIPVEVSSSTELNIDALPTADLELESSPLEVGPETWPGLGTIHVVPSIGLIPMGVGLGLGLVIAGGLRALPAFTPRRTLSRRRELEHLRRELKTAQGQVAVGQAARAYLSAWSGHTADPISVLAKISPIRATELQEAFVALDRSDFGGGEEDASQHVVSLLLNLRERRI